ncbi:hypothetical protein [Pseudozobellia thermophila]|uniref:Uncharacterized protein n=1 Tax=Pseudozobellia thermophila TaxID=192903 RepID=A0A1M6I5U2_9FLAO|nr:hypothetical protein [Pseudozobellia thermophila]SHJ29799.1 hypothetical protein SAMN04488513_103340 [Pseudozobellia thermophila]
MKTGKKNQQLSVLFVALALATAWAIRGQFGHEQGAAWAGAIGGLALVLASGRKDWYNKAVMVALASAVGWGAGGMISYGQVVGYGRSVEFFNAYYGFAMLFVIGALFGLLGGGLVGLVLGSTETKKVKWGALLSEMTAGGILSYYFLIEQIGFKMTPPRSEAWAVVLGSGLAMLWHMAREDRNSEIRVAIYSALGGGFGFSFGNFLHIVGDVLDIPFNTWNIMEYSIGFFGGLGMAYGVFSSKWPVESLKPKRWMGRSGLFLILVVIPLIVYRESLAYGHLMKRLGDTPNLEATAFYSTVLAAVAMLGVAVFLFFRLRENEYTARTVALFLFTYLSSYTLMSYIVKGLLGGRTILNHHLYVVNILVLYLLYKKIKFTTFQKVVEGLETKKWWVLLVVVLLFMAFYTFIAINSHGEMSGAHNRF